MGKKNRNRLRRTAEAWAIVALARARAGATALHLAGLVGLSGLTGLTGLVGLTGLTGLTGLAALTGLTGCGRSTEGGCRPDPAADAPGPPVAVQHLEKPFLRIKTTADARQFLDAYPGFARRYLQREPGRETQLLGLMANMAPNPALQQLGRETAAAFPDSAALGRELGAYDARFYN